MLKKFLIPTALILTVILAACGGGQTAEPVIDTAAASQPAAASDSDGDMDEMTEGHDDDMASEVMGEETEGHDDDMDGEAMGEETEGHESDMDGETMDEAGGDAEMEMEGDAESMEAPAADRMDLPLWQTLAVTNAATGETFSFADFEGKTVFVEPMATWCGNCRSQQGQVREAKAQLGDDVVFVGLSLETTLPAADLAQYAQDNGFDWTYAVMSEELLKGLADEFGRSITSAPSTPHFIIRPDGSFSALSTGIHSAEEIVTQIQEAQG